MKIPVTITLNGQVATRDVTPEQFAILHDIAEYARERVSDPDMAAFHVRVREVQ